MKHLYLICLVLFNVSVINAQFYGPDDFRISDAGGSGSTNSTVEFPDVDYGFSNQQFLAVWSSDDTDQPGVIDNDKQILGRFIDLSGNLIGSDFLISSLNLGNTSENEFPRVAYNSSDDNFMVVYQGEPTNGEDEIYGVVLDPNGMVVSADFRITDFGGSSSSRDIRTPGIAYNPNLNEFLVVFITSDFLSSPTVVDIEGQRVGPTGNLIGNRFSVSSINTAEVNGSIPDVIFNNDTNEYVVTYVASPISNQEGPYATIVAQDGQVGSTTALSTRGSISPSSFGNRWVRAAHNPVDHTLLFVFDMDNSRSGEIDVIGAIYDNAMNILVPEFDISRVGNSDTRYDAATPDVTWLPSDNLFYVVYRANPFLSNRSEREIFMNSVSSTGSLGNRLQVSSAPIDEEGNAKLPRVVSNGDGALLTVYEAEDTSTTNMMVNGEYEIFGQLYGTPTLSSEIEEMIDFIIYPNPAEDYIYLTGLTKNLKEIKIINELGQTVLKESLDFEVMNQLNIGNLTSGIYFLEAMTPSGSVVFKFVKM
ncbi:hypothetical protein BST97_13920 [Nonlabens spongiae]|uniref:Secretion system C-terminal sorting domain-containing protein n=1 Tax=Nonlabens spongiae TaxID=331648 RepID=A0A1W6MN44_9FLAO|nr:T9SS type A sorting domain-containing protein [Nonlabens spongiae]ARN78997.1 hypothetical protein BST97_13920 [Nonlabens spongiae]